MTRIKDIKNNKTYYITYDANKCGQPIKMWLKEKEQNLLWEDKNLIQIGEHIKYSYNTKGIRTKKETEEGTTEYSLIGSKIMKMEKVTSSGKITMYFTYDQRDELQSVTESNKEYYYIKDITGNIIKIKDEEGNSIVEYKYDAYGKVEKTIIENNNVSKYNPFIYKGYYYDEETELYYCNTRYYSPEIGRFLQVSDVSELNPHSINGLNLYAYANNNRISYSYNNVSKKIVPTLSSFAMSTNMNVVLIPSTIGGSANKTSTNPLSFSVGLLTPEKYEMPSWMSVYAFYAKGTLGWGYTFGDGYSLASFSTGVLDATFHTPKWFSSLPNDHCANPNIYLGFGTWNVNASVGAGISGTAEIISGTVGLQFGNAISIGVKGYVGIGFTIDFTNGIKFGIGLGLGYEISLNIDWYQLFH